MTQRKGQTVGVAVQGGIDLGRHPDTRRAPDSGPTPERPRVAVQEPEADQDPDRYRHLLCRRSGSFDPPNGPSEARARDPLDVRTGSSASTMPGSEPPSDRGVAQRAAVTSVSIAPGYWGAPDMPDGFRSRSKQLSRASDHHQEENRNDDERRRRDQLRRSAAPVRPYQAFLARSAPAVHCLTRRRTGAVHKDYGRHRPGEPVVAVRGRRGADARRPGGCAARGRGRGRRRGASGGAGAPGAGPRDVVGGGVVRDGRGRPDRCFRTPG